MVECVRREGLDAQLSLFGVYAAADHALLSPRCLIRSTCNATSFFGGVFRIKGDALNRKVLKEEGQGDHGGKRGSVPTAVRIMASQSNSPPQHSSSFGG